MVAGVAVGVGVLSVRAREWLGAGGKGGGSIKAQGAQGVWRGELRTLRGREWAVLIAPGGFLGQNAHGAAVRVRKGLSDLGGCEVRSGGGPLEAVSA